MQFKVRFTCYDAYMKEIINDWDKLNCLKIGNALHMIIGK